MRLFAFVMLLAFAFSIALGCQTAVAEPLGASWMHAVPADITVTWGAIQPLDSVAQAVITYMSYLVLSPDLLQPDPPAAPTLTASPGIGEVTLAWNVPDHGGSSLTKYVIEGKLDSDSQFVEIQSFDANARTATMTCSPDLTCQSPSTVTGSGDTVSATLSNLGDNTKYSFKVHAFSTMAGHPSNVATVTTFDVPGTPKNLTGEARDGEAVLAWDAPDDNGGTPITGYMVVARIGTVNPFVNHEQYAVAGVNSVTGLTNGIPYEFAVYAINGVGSGSVSNSVTVTPREPTVRIYTTQTSVTEGNPVAAHIAFDPAPPSNLQVYYSVSQQGNFVPSIQIGLRGYAASGDHKVISVPTTDNSAFQSPGSVTFTLNPVSGYTIDGSNSVTIPVYDKLPRR